MPFSTSLRYPSRLSCCCVQSLHVPCRLAVEAIRGVHPGVVTMALNNSLWSQEEEALLNRIPSVSVVGGAGRADHAPTDRSWSLGDIPAFASRVSSSVQPVSYGYIAAPPLGIDGSLLLAT